MEGNRKKHVTKVQSTPFSALWGGQLVDKRFLQELEKYKAKGSSSVRLCPICQNGVSTTFSTHRWVLLLSAIERYDREKCSRYLQNVHSMRRKFSTGPKS